MGQVLSRPAQGPSLWAGPRSYLDLGLGFFVTAVREAALAFAGALAEGLDGAGEAAAFLASPATSVVRTLILELSLSDLVWRADNLVAIFASGLALGMKRNLAY